MVMTPTWGARVGTLVARRRHELKLTQQKLSERAGLSRPLIGGLEAGIRPQPSAETVRKLAIALEWPELTHLLGRPTVTGASGGGRRQAKATEYWDYAGLARRPYVEWAACGVPMPSDGVVLTASDDQTDTIALPERSEEAVRLIGPRGFAVGVRGQSMTNWGLGDGDVVWVNPDKGRGYGMNRPVLARMLDSAGFDLGMVVKVLKLDREADEYLRSDGDEGDNEARYYSFEFFAPCVWWQPRGGALVRRQEATGVGSAPRRVEDGVEERGRGADRGVEEVLAESV